LLSIWLAQRKRLPKYARIMNATSVSLKSPAADTGPRDDHRSPLTAPTPPAYAPR
jgi:hypothetical protein